MAGQKVPSHLAIIMDGNGRWAKSHHMPRLSGHKQGKQSVKAVIKGCLEKGVHVLTLFAFGQENWKRPAKEVRNLFRLLFLTLKRDIHELNEKGIRIRILGSKEGLNPNLIKAIHEAERLTAHNDKLALNLMINYSGRWDILQAAKAAQGASEEAFESEFERHLMLADFEAPDLLIRTAGVQRLSNFLMWDLAYTELYFTQKYWPQFGEQELDEAINHFASQERRFGLISEQVKAYA